MKQIFYLFAFIACISCTTSKDYIIDSDYSYRGNFKRYKTFNFIKDASSNVEETEAIKEIIVARMGYQGYRLANRKPDLLISHKIFASDFEFSGYAQPSFESWLNIKPDRIVSIESDSLNERERRDFIYASDEVYDHRDLQMRQGTILITFFDRRQDIVIWQGYASGIFSDSSDQKRNLKRAISQIYDRYRILAEDYNSY